MRRLTIRVVTCGSALFLRLGQKEDAVNEGRKAVELLPESQDDSMAPGHRCACQNLRLGRKHDEAFRLLDHLLAVPSGLTVPLLKVDPVWDPLRNDPRFPKTLPGKTAVNLHDFSPS